MRHPIQVPWLHPCLSVLTVLAVLCAPAAFAGSVKRVAELPEVPFRNPSKVSAHRFIQVGVDWERDAKKRPVSPRFQIFDVQARKVLEVPLPLPELPKTHLDAVGPRPSPTLVHHDGEVTSFLLTAFENYQQVATYFCQFDHRTKRFSDLVELLRWSESRTFTEVGFDPQDRYFYYAASVTGEGAQNPRMELARVDLKTRGIDWTMTLELPKRTTPVELMRGVFSPDAAKLALHEYYDLSNHQKRALRPTQQVYVIDLPAKQVRGYPVPPSATAPRFTPDSRSLLIASNDTGELLRIDLVAKKVAARSGAYKYVHDLVPTPSGKSVLVLANTQRNSPRVIEVRRLEDLKLQVSIPARLLYPGHDRVSHVSALGGGGRLLMLPYLDNAGFPAEKGVRLYELPDEVDSMEVDGSGLDAKEAWARVLGMQFADARHIQYQSKPVDMGKTFAPLHVDPKGGVVLTGIYSQNSDGDYQPGRTKPVVVRLNSAGKKLWERVLTAPGFRDYSSGGVALTKDGGCLTFIQSYVEPNRPPVTRLVKLDAKGKVRWDLAMRPGGKRPRVYGDRFELRDDGSVEITGRAFDGAGKASAWKAVVDPRGKIASEELPAR